MNTVHLLHDTRDVAAAQMATALFHWLSIDPKRALTDRLGIACRVRNESLVQVPLPALDAGDAAIVLLGPTMLLEADAAWRDVFIGLGRQKAVLPLRLEATPETPLRLDRTPLNVFNSVAIDLRNSVRAVQRACFAAGEFLLREWHDGQRVKIFLSHAKLDGLQITEELRLSLDRTGVEAFFDARDIQSGAEWRGVLQSGVSSATALLSVRTDRYATRFWCREELRVAKEFDIPVVILDAVEHGEDRTLPLLANAPSVRAAGDDWVSRVFLRCFEAALRAALHRRRVEASAGRAKIAPPELMDFGGDRTASAAPGLWIYPDPPLPLDERNALSNAQRVAGVIAMTPHERLAERFALPPGSLLALSISDGDPQELSARGLRSEHVRHAFLAIARLILLARLRPAYGGDWRLSGYTAELIQLVADYGLSGGAGHETRLRNYLTPSAAAELSLEKRASASLWCEVVTTAAGATSDGHPNRALELSLMRRQMALDCAARIVIGGKTSGYSGIVPGVLEEVFWMQACDKPILAFTGFGAAAGLLLSDPQRVEAEYARWRSHVVAHALIEAPQRVGRIVRSSQIDVDPMLAATADFLAELAGTPDAPSPGRRRKRTAGRR